MHYRDLLATRSATMPALLEVFGRKEFPGWGRFLFSPSYYAYTGQAIWQQVHDAQIREWLVNWFSALFKRDNPKFKPDLFARFIARHGTWNGATPGFKQRHLYYLAYEIRGITDLEIRRFVADWVGDLCRATNPDFKADRWAIETGTNATGADQATGPKLAAGQGDANVPADDLDEARGAPTGAPGFGQRAHGGFGQRFFRQSHYRYIAHQILLTIHDPALRTPLADWFAAAFHDDDPTFDSTGFRQMVADGAVWGTPDARFQQRHFYFLAHEIAATDDAEIRDFLCEWLGRLFRSLNSHFQLDRWRKYCHLAPTDPTQQGVQRARDQLSLLDQPADDPATATFVAFRLEHAKRGTELRWPARQITATVAVVPNQPEALETVRRQLRAQGIRWSEQPTRWGAKPVDEPDAVPVDEGEVVPFPARRSSSRPDQPANGQVVRLPARQPPASDRPTVSPDDEADLRDLGWRRKEDEHARPVWLHTQYPQYEISKLDQYHLNGPHNAIGDTDHIGTYANPLQAHQALLRHRKQATLPAGTPTEAHEPYLQAAGWQRAADEQDAQVWRHPTNANYKIRMNHKLYYVHGPRDVLNNRTLVGSYARPELAHRAFRQHSNQPLLRLVPKGE